MVHQVGAHGVVQAQLEGHLELGAHAVCRTDQDGILPALRVEAEKRAKTANAAQHVAVKGFLRQVLDAFLGSVAAADVYSGVGIGNGVSLDFVRHNQGFLRQEDRARLAESSILAGFAGFAGVLPITATDRKKVIEEKMES